MQWAGRGTGWPLWCFGGWHVESNGVIPHPTTERGRAGLTTVRGLIYAAAFGGLAWSVILGLAWLVLTWIHS